MKFGTLGKWLCQNLFLKGNLLPSYIRLIAITSTAIRINS